MIEFAFLLTLLIILIVSTLVFVFIGVVFLFGGFMIMEAIRTLFPDDITVDYYGNDIKQLREI